MGVIFASETRRFPARNQESSIEYKTHFVRLLQPEECLPEFLQDIRAPKVRRIEFRDFPRASGERASCARMEDFQFG
jgi:hypothetical protein